MDLESFIVTLLGTGTSTGIPIPGCKCRLCQSDDPRDKRLRASALIEFRPKRDRQKDSPINVLIDTSTDLRAQALRAKIEHIDAVLYTHAHADHVFGIEDLRGYNYFQQSAIPIYANRYAATQLETTFAYIFAPDPDYEGGALPQLTLNVIEAYQSFKIGGVEILPVAARHGRIDVLGYRVGPFAYLTDCCELSSTAIAALANLEVLVIDGLRITPHPTHFNFAGAVSAIEQINPQKAYLTHLSHEVSHKNGNSLLREMSSLPIELAYDELSLTFRL